MPAEGNQPFKLTWACGKMMWPGDRERTTLTTATLLSDFRYLTCRFGYVVKKQYHCFTTCFVIYFLSLWCSIRCVQIFDLYPRDSYRPFNSSLRLMLKRWGGGLHLHPPSLLNMFHMLMFVTTHSVLNGLSKLLCYTANKVTSSHVFACVHLIKSNQTVASGFWINPKVS